MTAFLYLYTCTYADRIPPSISLNLPQIHIVETEQAGGQHWRARRALCDVKAGETPPADGRDWRSPALATCRTCKAIFALIGSVTPDDCPGSGRPWTTGLSKPVCKTCHIGPGGLGVRAPQRRKPAGWKGRVPRHIHQERARS